MHKYMRAIGFSEKLNKIEQEALLAVILKNPDEVSVWNRKDGQCFSEVEKDIAYHIGICLRGEGILGTDFEPEYYFPYIKSTNMKAASLPMRMCPWNGMRIRNPMRRFVKKKT